MNPWSVYELVTPIPTLKAHVSYLVDTARIGAVVRYRLFIIVIVIIIVHMGYEQG